MKRLNRRESAGWTRVSVAAACGDNGETGGEIDNGDRKGGSSQEGVASSDLVSVQGALCPTQCDGMW